MQADSSWEAGGHLWFLPGCLGFAWRFTVKKPDSATDQKLPGQEWGLVSKLGESQTTSQPEPVSSERLLQSGRRPQEPARLPRRPLHAHREGSRGCSSPKQGCSPRCNAAHLIFTFSQRGFYVKHLQHLEKRSEGQHITGLHPSEKPLTGHPVPWVTESPEGAWPSCQPVSPLLRDACSSRHSSHTLHRPREPSVTPEYKTTQPSGVAARPAPSTWGFTRRLSWGLHDPEKQRSQPLP